VFTGFVGTTSEITTHGSSYDTRHITTIPQFSGAGNYHSVWAWLTGIVCRTTNWLSDGTQGGVSRNQTGLVCGSLRAPRNRAFWPIYSTRDTFLQIGVSTWKVDATGRVQIDKIITHHQTEKGAPDTVFRDIQSIAQIVFALRKFRAILTFEHGQKIAADDNPGDLQAISTPADVDATLIHTHAELVSGGVLENTVEFARRSQVARNQDNPNRYDIYAPLDRANPLDILAANATVYAQYRPAV
jgi:phage tail sheath gpL-like